MKRHDRMTWPPPSSRPAAKRISSSFRRWSGTGWSTRRFWPTGLLPCHYPPRIAPRCASDGSGSCAPLLTIRARPPPDRGGCPVPEITRQLPSPQPSPHCMGRRGNKALRYLNRSLAPLAGFRGRRPRFPQGQRVGVRGHRSPTIAAIWCDISSLNRPIPESTGSTRAS